MNKEGETTAMSISEVAEPSAATQPPERRVHLRWLMLVTGAATIFAAAFLLFSLQPLVGKIVLPRFGGSASVWSVCLVFFQTALLVGYLLAYGIAKLRPKTQIIGYAVLWVAAAALASLPVGEVWRLTWFDNPAGELLAKLVQFVALPCVMVSSVSVLVQVWTRLSGISDPYGFYAVSNAGSLGALLAYPTLIEPNLSVPGSAGAWTWGFRVVALLVAGLSIVVWAAHSRASAKAEEADDNTSAPRWLTTLAWMFLSAVGSGLLVSFTSRITQDIAPIPMLWVIPLSLYLLTFILCFSHRGLYRRDWVLPLALLAFAAQTFITLRYEWHELGFDTEILGAKIAASGVTVGLVVACAAFFLLVMLLHGELYALRPAARFLSRYYVAISAGGAVGGAFVSLIAPALFKIQLEYPLLLGLALAVLLWVTFVHGVRLLQNEWLNLTATVGIIVIGLAMTIIRMAAPQSLKTDETKISYYRNVYGPMRVEATPARKSFLHGTTVHGTQLTAPETARRPISYYSEQSGVGMVYRHFAEEENRARLKIGAIGLGVGTLAAYSRGGGDASAAQQHTVTFYEIDPDVAEIARTHFTYLADAGDKTAIHFGDARTTLEQQAPQEFDILVVDAFTGDGIPIHLLTREALQLYQRHVTADGAILFHISNKYLRLESVLGNVAHALGFHALTIDHDPEGEDMDGSSYVVLSTRNLPLTTREWEDGGESTVRVTSRDRKLRIWTDDYSNLFSVLDEP